MQNFCLSAFRVISVPTQLKTGRGPAKILSRTANVLQVGVWTPLRYEYSVKNNKVDDQMRLGLADSNKATVLKEEKHPANSGSTGIR